ncbi:unnamed protein product, partial [Hapterophycus canaliculatus]
LSLEGNPVCGAANYRAHVISLASPSLKTLDHREMLTVLRAECWLAFDQSELDKLERLVLDEAADVFEFFSFSLFVLQRPCAHPDAPRTVRLPMETDSVAMQLASLPAGGRRASAHTG